MATGSVHAFQSPLTCDVCEGSENVDWYCRECRGNICTACKVNHEITRISRNHQIIPILDGLKQRSTEEECSSHQSCICSLHCNTCCTLICSKCISGGVHRGHDIDEIEDAMKKAQQEIKDYYNTLKGYLPHCEAEEAKITGKFTDCENWITSIKQDINKHQNELKDKIDRSCDDLLKMADEEGKHKKTEVENAHQMLQDTVREIKQQMNSSIEVQTKLVSEQIKFNSEKPDVIHLDLPKAPTLNFSTFVHGKVDTVETVELVGKLTVQVNEVQGTTRVQQTPHSVKSAVEFPRISVDRRRLGMTVSEFCAIGTNFAWVKGRLTKKLKLLCLDQDISPSQIVRQIYAIEIADFFATQSTIFTTNYIRSCIRILNETGKVTKVIDTHPYKPSGICLGKNGQDVVVCVTENEIYSNLVIYNKDGEKTGSIKYTEKSLETFTDQRVIQNNRGDYGIAHHDHKMVYVVNCNGLPRYAYDGSGDKNMTDAFYPRNICSDVHNNLFVADYNNHNIHMLSEDGKFIQIILSAQDGVMKPIGLYNDIEGKLWIGQENGDLDIVTYWKNDIEES